MFKKLLRAERQKVADYLEWELAAIEDPNEPGIAGLEIAVELIRNLDDVPYQPKSRRKKSMSNEVKLNVIETNLDAFNMGYGVGRDIGVDQERERIIDRLDIYLQQMMQADPNTGDELSADWHEGFQAALAVVIGDQQ